MRRHLRDLCSRRSRVKRPRCHSADSVAMQMRATGDAAPRRRIEPLVGGESSLRVVAWLAGNLARDQATELMDARLGATVASWEAVTPAPPEEPPPPTPTTSPAMITPPAPPAAVAATSRLSTNPDLSDGEAGWRVGLSVGALGTTWHGNLDTMGFQRFELAAPSHPGKWSWTAALDVFGASGTAHTYLLAGRMNRRFALVPGWLAADLGWGGGLLIRRYDVESSYGTRTDTDGPSAVVHLGAMLALVRWQVGEVVAGLTAADYLEDWRVPWLGWSAGLRVALP